MAEQQHSFAPQQSDSYTKKLNLRSTKIDFGYMAEKQVTSLEYCFMEMVRCLSVKNSAYGFRCNATYEYLALQLDISTITAKRMAKSLSDRGLLLIYNYGNSKLMCTSGWKPKDKVHDFTVIDHDVIRDQGLTIDEMICMDLIYQCSRLSKRSFYTHGVDFLAEKMMLNKRSVNRIIKKMTDKGFLFRMDRQYSIEKSWITERFRDNIPVTPTVFFGPKNSKTKRQNDTLRSDKMIRSSAKRSDNLIRNTNVFYNNRIDSNSKESQTFFGSNLEAKSDVEKTDMISICTEGIHFKKDTPQVAPPPPRKDTYYKKSDTMQIEKEQYAMSVRRIIEKHMRGSEVPQDEREQTINSFIEYLAEIQFELKEEPKPRDYKLKSKDYGYMRDKQAYVNSCKGVITVFEKHVLNRLRFAQKSEGKDKTITCAPDKRFLTFCYVLCYFYECTQTRGFFEGTTDADWKNRMEELKEMLKYEFKHLHMYQEKDTLYLGIQYAAMHRTTYRTELKEFVHKLKWNYDEQVSAGKKLLGQMDHDSKPILKIKENLLKKS